jgi:hypothetical protein
MAKATHRFDAGCLGRPTGANEIRHPHLEVTLNFEIHLGVGARPAAGPQVEQASISAWRHDGRYAVRLASAKIDVTDRV